MEFTHEELFQFYLQVKTNENRLSVHVCACVLCVFVCVCVCATWCWLRGPQIEGVQMGVIWRCAEWKCGGVEVVTCSRL